MNQKKICFNLYGLRARFGFFLVVSAIICSIAFLSLQHGMDYLFTTYFEHSDFQQIHIQKQYEDLQDFIDANQISSKDFEMLGEWEKKQPIILFELYADDKCIYSSIYDAPINILVLDKNRDSSNNVSIRLADREVQAFIYSDFTYQFSIINTVISLVAALLLFILLFLYHSRKLIGYICRLNEEVQILEGGNLEYCVSEEGNDEITDLARSMNRMRETLQNQIVTEQKLYQANRQLITEMSHDLRTPLTGIMLYLEILRSHRYESDEQLQDYLEKIDAKAHHMKLLSDHLFEYSMQDVTKKQLTSQALETVFSHAIDAMEDELKARGFSVKTNLEWRKYFVQVNVEYIQRIFENIISNIEKYAERTADIMIDTIYSDKYCGFLIMNTLSLDYHETESNGVGIESICSMMRQMNGVCNVEQTDTTFEITLLFPIQ